MLQDLSDGANMDPVRNPYSPGAGNRPPALVGRADDTAAFDIAVQRLSIGRHDRSVIVTGLRGAGKTVLLREYGSIAARHGWLSEHVEVAERADFVAVVAELVRRTLMRMSAGRRLTDRMRRAFGVLKSFQIRWNLPEGGDIAIGADPVLGSADSGLLDRDLAGLLAETGELARDRGVGVALTVDEMQFLSREDFTALIMGLHEISQRCLPLLVAGAGLPSLLALTGDARTYAERLFEFRTVGRLEPDGTAAALIEPAEAEGVRWDTPALERVQAATDGYPYFVQEFGKQAWLVARSPSRITDQDVADAVPLALEELDRGFFRVRFDRTNASERAYMTAMASLGSGEYASGAVAAALGKTTTQVASVRDTLIRRGLCYSPRYGVIAFSVPMFDRYMRRRMSGERGDDLAPESWPQTRFDAEEWEWDSETKERRRSW